MNSESRHHTVQEHYGMPTYVEERTLPELPERSSQINDDGIPEGKGLRAGAARVDVTPDLSGPEPVQPRGFLKNPTGIHDRLYVRALVLDNGEEKLALVSWDKLNAETLEDISIPRRQIHERTGIPEANILIGCTHTHSGCESNFPEATVEAVARAWENMTDARIGAGSKMIYGIGSNRRLPDGTGFWGNNQPNPEAVMDNECGVIRIEDVQRNIIAVVTNYSSHPSVISIGNTLISGDYAGIGMQEIEKRLGGGAVAMFLQGCAGDTGTHTFRTGRTITEAEKLGNRFADAVMDILPHIDVNGWVRLAAKNRILELPQKQFESDNPTLPPIVEGTTSIRDEIQALVIGDTLLLSVGSMEAYVEIGLMIKDASPFKRTFTIAYSNGPWLGYLPSLHGFAVRDPDAEGSARTHFSYEAPSVLIDESVKLIGEMKPDNI